MKVIRLQEWKILCLLYLVQLIMYCPDISRAYGLEARENR